jgi:hypothetical protein
METSGGILGRLGEKMLGWIAFALILLASIGVYQMGPDRRGAILDGFWHSLLWLAIVVAVPWSVKLFIKPLLEIGENWVGLVLLAGLLLIDVIAGFLLMTGWPSGLWSWTAVVAALGVAGTYNYLVTAYLADMAGG